MLAAKMAKPQQVGVPASEASELIGLLGISIFLKKGNELFADGLQSL